MFWMLQVRDMQMPMAASHMMVMKSRLAWEMPLTTPTATPTKLSPMDWMDCWRASGSRRAATWPIGAHSPQELSRRRSPNCMSTTLPSMLPSCWAPARHRRKRWAARTG